jgi:hypothetical protein
VAKPEPRENTGMMGTSAARIDSRPMGRMLPENL